MSSRHFHGDENLWVVDNRNSLNGLVVFLDFLGWVGWDFVSEKSLSSLDFDLDFGVAVVWLQDAIFQVVLAVGVKHLSVQIVGNSSAVLNFANHVSDNVHLDDLVGLLSTLRWGGN